MTAKQQISIIGCGWLGLSLAKTLIANDCIIKGSTTSEGKLSELKKQNILPYLVTLNENGIEGQILDVLSGSETIIINIPPGLRRNPNKNHIKEIEHLIEAIEQSDISKVIYVSSTSVYPDTEKLALVTEASTFQPDSVSGKQLLAIEKRLLENTNFHTTVLRFGGLFGEDRHPSKYLSGRDNIKNPKAPVNLIHKEDCISIILNLINKNSWGHIFNAVIPEHPTKKEYYTTYCETHNLPLPEFDTNSISKGKKISSEKLVQLLNYRFERGL